VPRPGTVAGCAIFTGVAAALLLAFGPPGVDRAAHVYHTAQFAEHGWRMWNNYWYAGRYELLNYSILFYPLAAWFGMDVVVVASLAAGSALWAALMRVVAGPRWRLPAIAFAAIWPTVVLTGQYPFALGAAFALASVLAVVRHRYTAGVIAAMLALLSSPLAFLFLTMTLAGLTLGRHRRLAGRRARAAAFALLLLVIAEFVLLRLFPVPGHQPFPLIDMLSVLLFCGVGLRVSRGDRPLQGFFAAYAAVVLLVYLFPSGVGGNAERLADYGAVPIFLVAYVRRGAAIGRGALIVLLVAAVFQAIPQYRVLKGGLAERANQAAFWAGAVAWLHAHEDQDHRVEVVATWGHWESYHLAQQDIPLTRGWFRQDDFPINAPLYDGALDVASYRAWLASLGVEYVVLPRDELDYSSRTEAALIPQARRDGVLVFQWGDANNDIYAVSDPTPLLTREYGLPSDMIPAGDRPAVLRFRATELSLWLPGPGVYDLRVRYTPFWQVSDPSAICAAPTSAPAMTRLVASRGGPVNVKFDVTLARSASEALGASPPTCPEAPPASMGN
jgi:hypothetical protein